MFGCAHTASNTKKAQAYFEIGLSFYSDGRFPEAIEQFTEASSLEPGRTDIQMNLGLAYLKIEDFDRAIKIVRKACDAIPNEGDCWNNLSYVYFKAGRAREAQAAAQRAIDIPTYSTPELALSNFARASMKLKDIAGAEKALAKSLRLHPEFCQAHVLLAKVWGMKNDFETALEECKRAIGACPQLTEAHLWEAYVFYKLGQRKSAELKYQQIIKTFPHDPAGELSRLGLAKLKHRLPLEEPAT